MTILDIIEMLKAFKLKNPNANKADVEAFFQSYTKLTKVRSVFPGDDFAFRFSEANQNSFSNVVLSLSALQKYDSVPVVICIVRRDRLDFRIANTTFLKRISQSSHSLTTSNIRGSFLGHDIMSDYEGTPNQPEFFKKLSEIHSRFNWGQNVERLVAATNAIVARSNRYESTPSGNDLIFDAPVRAAEAMMTSEYRDAEKKLTELVIGNRETLLKAAGLDNVNIRGNTIEQILTGAGNLHELADVSAKLPGGGYLVIDIKTKLLDRASAPKAYNIDKMLALLSQPNTVFSFFFVGISASRGITPCRLVSIFDPAIIDATRIVNHWAGRSSRGVTQLSGDISSVFDPTYAPSVSIERARTLLKSFLER
jgi:hypothetical protein